MTVQELEKLTVLELRKVAKDNHVVLGAGLSKADIVQKIASSTKEETESEMKPTFSSLPPFSMNNQLDGQMTIDDLEKTEPEPRPAPQLSRPSRSSAWLPDPSKAARPSPETPVKTKQPLVFDASPAWQATPSTPQRREQPSRFSGKPAYQAPATAQQRPAWNPPVPVNRPVSADSPVRVPVVRSNFGPRFGPAARTVSDPVPAAQDPDLLPSPLPDRRFTSASTENDQESMPAMPRTQLESDPAFVPVPSAMSGPRIPEGIPAESGITAPTLEELLASDELTEGSGVLEVHPEGYGFLRAPSLMPSSRDIYVSLAQIHRFSLRTGDFIEGRIRSRRQGDKYNALLLVSRINGIEAETLTDRPVFDELTAIYPNRRISLEGAPEEAENSMRLVDLIAPIGFGQRALLLCPPQTGKREMIRNLANTIHHNYPEAHIMTLLTDVTPEDATQFRETTSGDVLASTFDQPPEFHLRLADIVLERAMRLAEGGADVILLVDSLTRLAKIYTTSATQQGRSLPGMVNPASLFKAKRLFGSARCLREGGSLTVFAAMDIENLSKVDEALPEEFKGSANMVLTFDRYVAAAHIMPALNLSQSYTRNSDMLLDDKQKEGLNYIRTMLGNTKSAVAIPQLMDMMDKTDTNAELLLKMKQWFAIMNR